MEHYVPILVFILVGAALPLVALVLARAIRLSAPDPGEGDLSEGDADAPGRPFDSRFSIRFYLVAVLLVVVEVGAVFFFSWALLSRKLALLGLVGMTVFLAILVVGGVYAWKRGAAEWV